MTIRPTVVLVLFAVGCGGDASKSSDAGGGRVNPSTTPAAKLAACATLTQEEVSAIVGEKVSASQTDTPGTWADGANTSVCNYYGGSGTLLSLTITQPASPAGGSQGLASALQKDNASSGIPASPVEPLDGLGDAAAQYRLPQGVGGVQYVVAQKGAIRIGVTASVLEQARAMAEKGLARVP